MFTILYSQFINFLHKTTICWIKTLFIYNFKSYKKLCSINQTYACDFRKMRLLKRAFCIHIYFYKLAPKNLIKLNFYSFIKECFFAIHKVARLVRADIVFFVNQSPKHDCPYCIKKWRRIYSFTPFLIPFFKARGFLLF